MAWVGLSHWQRLLQGRHRLTLNANSQALIFVCVTGYVDKQANDLDHAYELIKEHTSKGEAVSIALLGNAAQILPQIVQRAKMATSSSILLPTKHQPMT